MLARTTLSLETQYLNQLKELATDSSLSKYVNQIIKDFLERKNKEQIRKKMVENYKEYAKSFDMGAFKEMEEASLSDLERLNPYRP